MKRKGIVAVKGKTNKLAINVREFNVDLKFVIYCMILLNKQQKWADLSDLSVTLAKFDSVMLTVFQWLKSSLKSSVDVMSDTAAHLGHTDTCSCFPRCGRRHGHRGSGHRSPPAGHK